VPEIYHPSFGHDSFNVSFDSPMSFRDRHRFLDGVYNSNPNPDEILAKKLESISRMAGLSMEEVLLWFDDEKERRAKLLSSRQHWSQQSSQQFPLSPASTNTPGPNSAVTLSMTQFASTSTGSFLQLQDILSPPSALSPQRPSIPVRGKRGRPAKDQSSTALEPPSSESKRQKTSVEYPCPDCGRSFAAERWSEHIKRVHFPDQVWVCQKTNESSGKICSSNPIPRPDNFATHLKGEHRCTDLEISQLKVAWKFGVVNFFHHICGFCDDILKSRDESIEHIKCHFREISHRPNPPEDLGLSEWKEKCGSDHKLKRGVHYQVSKNENGDVSDRDRDHDDGSGPNQGNPANRSNENSNHHSDNGLNPDSDSRSGNDSSFYSSKTSGHMKYRQNPTASSHSCTKSSNDGDATSICSSFGLEDFILPFTSIRRLGSGGHGLVDEVMSAVSKKIFARKSVIRKSTEFPTSSQMAHLKNELAVLKELSHPHLVKLIGAYTDAEYSHIIMSPVADQNLADYMRSSKLSQPEHLLPWMGCLSSAMASLHKLHVQHLDVKPQNILVKGHCILLADFGTAKSFFNDDLGNIKNLTLTPMYCAPETMFHGRQDYSTDVFSLGCVFSEMITLYFGRSVQEFEDFRSKTGNKAFYLTLSETQEWVQQLPENAVPGALIDPRILPQPGSHREVLSKIMDMLAEIATERPKANEMHALFASIDQFRCSSCPNIERDTLGPTTCQSKISQKAIATANTTRSDWQSTEQQYALPSLRALLSAPSLSSAKSSAQESNLADNTCPVLPRSVSIADKTACMSACHKDNDFNFPKAKSHYIYGQEIYGFESMLGYLDAPDYCHSRKSQDSYSLFPSPAAGPIYPESQQYMNRKNSPPLYPAESPELRTPSLTPSTAPWPSASSSTMGLPYSNHGQIVPVPEWNSTGLGINPSIVGSDYDGFNQDFSYTTSGMEHELAFTDVTKSHVFVGECPKVLESSSSVSTFVPSNSMGMIRSLFDRHRNDASSLRSTQSPSFLRRLEIPSRLLNIYVSSVTSLHVPFLLFATTNSVKNSTNA
jgi:serine/threonine protein kinase